VPHRTRRRRRRARRRTLRVDVSEAGLNTYQRKFQARSFGERARCVRRLINWIKRSIEAGWNLVVRDSGFASFSRIAQQRAISTPFLEAICARQSSKFFRNNRRWASGSYVRPFFLMTPDLVPHGCLANRAD